MMGKLCNSCDNDTFRVSIAEDAPGLTFDQLIEFSCELCGLVQTAEDLRDDVDPQR